MPDPVISNLLKKLGSSDTAPKSIAQAESSTNLNSQIATSFNVEEGKALMRQQAKQVKEQFDRDLAETGYTPENIKEIKKSEDFWHNVFQNTKNVVSSTLNVLNPLNRLGIEAGVALNGESTEESVSQPRSAKEISQAYINASKYKQLFDRAKESGIVKQPDGTYGRLEDELPYMEDISIFDKIWNSAAINQNSLGDKKFSINWTPVGKNAVEAIREGKDMSKTGISQYYFTKDENGNDILGRADFRDIHQLKKAGNIFLNNFGPAPVKSGFWREFSAGLGNTKSSLERSLLNFGEGAYTLAHSGAKTLGINSEQDDSRVKKLQKFSDDYRAYNDLNNYEPAGEVGSTLGWLGAGVGQGAASLAQFAVMGAAAKGIGALVSPKLSAIGKLDNLTTFGAGAVMNYGEAYESALNAGLNKVNAAKVGMLTGAINGIIESAVGTNKLTDWLSGGGNRILAQRVLADLGGDVSETSMKKVLNTWQKQASGKIAQVMNTPILGNAIEEGIEEFSQTMTQKTVESLYDSFFANNKEVGKGKFGTEVFSMNTLKEALEAGFFGAILGGSMGSVKLGKEQYDKYVNKKTSNDAPILKYLADGNKDQVLSMVETLYSRGVINDNQKEFYTQKINNLAELVDKNEGRFAGLEEQYGKETATRTKGQALNVINTIASLDKELETLSKKEQTEDTLLEIKNKQTKRAFFNQYLEEEFIPREDGKVNAIEFGNYLNQEEVINNKFDRYITTQRINEAESKINSFTSKIERAEEELANIRAKKGKAAKEIRKEIELNEVGKQRAEFEKQIYSTILDKKLDEYNEITSDSYQAKLKIEEEEKEQEDTADKGEEETSAPINVQPGVEGNSEVEIDESEKPTNQLEDLLKQKEEILVELENNPDLDQETISELEQAIELIDTEINNLDTDIQLSQVDYQNQVTELAEKLATFADLDDDDKNQAFSAVKKEIERLIPAYRDQGIDVSELNKAHEDLTKEILSIRARIKAQKDAVLQQLEDDKKAKERNDRALVSSISFFDRVERVRFMNAHPDFWTDAEFNAIFLNTPIEEILSEIELIGATAESLGLKAGSIVGKWNNGTNIVTPEIVVSLSYRGKKLGNLNQLDSFTVNDPSEVNLTEEQLENTVVRNTKLIALLQQKGFLSSQDLKDIGFNLSWNGDFNLDTTVSRTLVKDLPNAKLVGKSGKSFYYLYDRVNQREITDLVTDPNNELDNIPSIPDDLQERYVVLVKANNGKLYWIGTQNQVLDKQSQDSIYKYIFEQVEELKQIVDPVKYKEKVSKINRYLESTIFVASNDETKQNTQIQLTTPSGTNSKYGLRLKGVKKRIELNQATYSTMDDLLAGLDLTNVNLRVPLVNNASVSETINSLSINLTPTLFKKPSAISIKIDEDKLNSKLVDAPTAETQVVETPVEEAEVTPTSSKVNVVAVEDLSVYDPEYNNLSEDIKSQIDSEVAPLLEQLNQAKGLKKEGIRVKIRAVINKYKPDSNMPVFSIGSSQETGDYNKAVNWIKSNLPDSISIEDVEKLLANIKNNGTTFGAFADNIIYLSKNLAKGTEYHEAFHAVFRLLLSDNQINIIYNKLSKTNNPTKKQLEALKNSSSAYINYTEKQLRDLYLEEVAADNFKDYGNKFNSSNPYKNVWNKIINWIRFITGNMDTLEALFYNINRGEFKKAKIVNNKFTNNISETVFQIYKKGVDNNNIPIVTSQSEGQTIVANLTKRLLQAKVNKLYPDLTDDKIIDKLIAEKASFYSIDENPYYETYLEQKGLSEDEDYIAIMSRNLEQKRNIYTLPENIKALKKDIKEKIRIFDIADEITDEERQQDIDSTGETFDVDPWTIGGETSFSKVLREYISLVTINTKDEYGQDMEEAVDFKKVYRGLVRALAGIEEDRVLPRFKALAEFDEDINAVFNQLISDLGLTNEGTLNAQDITKNYDLWRKFVTTFNNENVSWYTVLQSNEQSRLLESNTNSAKDIQFNNWLQNYNIAFEESKFDNDLRTSINKAADAINRTENIIVSSLQEAKNEAKTVVNEFKKLSINLSEAYVAYSLIKNSPYKGLDDSAKEILSAFTGVEGLYDGGNIGFIVTEFKSEFNPFLTTRDEKKKERGAVTRLKTIAAQNALFDPTIGESSFQNADGKSIYSIIRPSFGLVKLRWLRDAKTRLKLLQEEKTKKDNFIDPLESVTLNHLLANNNIDIIMANLTPSMIDGYRRTKIEGDIGQTEEGEGVTFGKFNSQEYLLADMLMFLSNRKVLNSIDENGRPIKLGESALFNINQMESSNTGYGVFLPVNDFTSVNQEVTDILFNYLAQEVIRINKVKNEFGKKDTVVWKGYNDSKKARGFKLMEFAGYELDELIDSITGNNKTSEEIYAELLKNKQQIVDSIETKLEEDISQYVEVLNNNGVLGLLPKVELLKRKYLTEGKSEMTDSQKLALIYNQYLNSYINTLGINNLLLDNYAKKVKNTTDWFKRAKGIIGSGADMGAGTTRVGVYKEPLKFINVKDLSDIDRDNLIEEERLRLEEGSLTEDVKKKRLSTFIKNIDKGKIQIADAQSYVTLDHKILQLKRWGRFPQQVSDIYDKLVLGKQITWEEKEILEDNNAALNSTKTVSYNGDYYFKLSEITLSPRLVGKVDENGDVILDANGRPLEAKEGFEYLFNKYISMLNQGVDQALPESASKMATIAPAEFAEDGNFDFTGSIMELENKFKRLQVETPSGKRHIIHGTQLIQLVNSEQEDNLPIDFKYNSDIKTLGELRALYRRLLADNRLESFKTALEYVRDPLSGKFNSIELTDKFYKTVLESGSDEVLSNFFSPNPETGERQFNWNLGPIVNKAEQLFLSHFSKGVLSQKVPGLKVSLMSDAGILIKDPVTGKMRSLAHMVKDEDGNYYSECLLPPFAEELLGKNPSDKDIQDVLKMFGIRIPTQDKHSMMSLKVVGFLPIEYGSIGIFPKEIVYLSGADFDIDSEFIHTADFFTDDAGRIRLYGTATIDENKYKEYIKWNTVNNKLLQKKLKTLSLQEALKSLNMPTTVKEFIDGKFINIGANNNAMLEAQIKFLTNDYVRERAATIPSSLTSIKEAEAIIRQALDLEEDNFVSPNSPLARFNANRSNMEGKDGIGPVALSNVVHALLSNYEQKLFSDVEVPVINGKIATGFDGIFTIDSDTNRKNDNISTLLSAMTDNAKEQLAKILTLTFNPRDSKTNTLPVASYMLSIGYTMEETVLFMNQPTIRAFVTGDLSIYNKLDELDAELGKLIGYKKGTKDYERVYFKLEEEYKKPLTSENMIDSLNEKDLEVYDLFHLREVSRLFGMMQLHAGYVSNISALMSLNKGVKSTFDENLRIEDVLNSLQLTFLNDFITDDVNSYDDLINKLSEKDYVKVINGKVYKNKNFPVFVISGLVDRTPFDARETLLNDPNTIQNIIIYKKIMDVSKEFFLMNTPVFIKLRKLVKTDSKNLIPFFMNKGLENFLQNEFPEKYQSLINAKDQAGYIIHQSGDNSVGRELYKLKRDPDFRNNLLIKMLSLKSPYSSSKIVSIEFPTRIKSEGDFYVNLNNAFKELFLNPKTTEFARKLYYYSYYKDGLQFKNKSFINTIPSWVFKDVSSSLDRLNNDFKDTNYTEYTSLNEKISSSIIDMLTSMATLDTSHKYLTNLDYINYNIKKAIAVSGNINTTNIKLLPTILKQINTETKSGFIDSLKKLHKTTGEDIYESLQDGIKYALSGYNENLNENTQELLSYGRVISSAKVFIDNKLQILTLEELVEYFLKTNVLPVALEVTYDKIKPVRDSGFNSTINDVSFIESYKAVVKTINKKEKTFKEEDKVDESKVIAVEDNNQSNLNTFVNHSGGAIGSDSEWDDIGKEFGMTNNKHYWTETQTPRGNTQISQQDFNEGKTESAKAAKRNFGYKYSVMKDSRLIRNWSQVKHSDAIFAIGKIAETGEKLFPKQVNDTRTAITPSVQGGTGYAVGMAINNNKPVYVFNQTKSDKYDVAWYMWDSNINDFTKIDTPKLTKNFAGIGTREINNEGKQAIRNVYTKTLNSIEDNTENVENDIYSKLGGKTASKNVVIKPWAELKVFKESISSNNIISTRIQGTNEHFGNPYSHDPAGKSKGLIKTETVKEAVQKYIDWVLNSQETRAQWIREQIQSGELKGKSILYYKELNEPSHATALDYLINKYNFDNSENNSNFVNKASEISLLDDLDLANDKDVFEKFQKIIKDSMEKDDKLNKLDSDVNEFTDDDGNPIC